MVEGCVRAGEFMAELQQGNAPAPSPASDDHATVRVAIVGGGCAGLTAAWELAKLNDENPKPRYDITVYESTWRLGGKAASVRDSEGRIIEHGLHVWLGFYENAFRLVRECCAYLEEHKLEPRLSFDEAFFPEPHLGVATKNAAGDWEAWTGMFPPMKGEPGTPLDAETNPFSLAGYMTRLAGLIRTLAQSVVAPPHGEVAPVRHKRGDEWRAGAAPSGAASQAAPERRSPLDHELEIASTDEPGASPGVQVERLARLLRSAVLVVSGAMLQAVAIAESWLREQSALPVQNVEPLKYLEAAVTQARKLLADIVQVDEDLRRKTEIIDLVLTIIVGLYRDKVMFDPRGLDALNDIDCRAWLTSHGATYTSVDSPFVRGLYDFAFAYRDGDKNQPALAAGQALRGALRMFYTYRGAMFWRARSGMGDVVFAPLYRALEHRGVKFEFLHELKGVGFSELAETNANRVEWLEFDISHRPKDGEWSPFDAKGGWPSTPGTYFDASAGVQRCRLTATERGFDAVVFALGKDAFVKVCKDLCDQIGLYRQMREHVKTVATQSVQLWLKKDLRELGWRRGPVVLTGIDLPSRFETWADMTHLLAAEPEHTAKKGVRSLAYLCGVLSKKDIDAAEGMAPDALVEKHAKDFLAGTASKLWPKFDGGSLRRMHYQANHTGSDRYTLALPGTLQHRVSPLDGSVVNMTIAGDWTDCGFNEGCIEAAVMSGRLAAHAISGGSPPLDDIIGYHHP